MSVTINSTSGHYYLDSWILASILHLATKDFCSRFLNQQNDPGGRQYAQMTQAARSCPANVAEGSARRDTSTETMMKLTDVARATLSELSYDYLSLLLSRGKLPWRKTDPDWQELQSIRLPKPDYSEDFMHDVSKHILVCKGLFDKWLKSSDWTDVANALLIICGRVDRMITRQLERQLKDFSRQGGFTENMTQSRLQCRREQAEADQAPKCPKCGKPMFRRTIRKGSRAGQEFWGCSGYPECSATREI